MSLFYIFRSGKNSKFWYYFRNYAYYLLPLRWLRSRRISTLLSNLEERDDYDIICKRLDYYNKMPQYTSLENFVPLSEHRPRRQKVYFFDTYKYTSLFPRHYLWSFLPGDITEVPSQPTIVKSRPLLDNNVHSVLMKLDLVRHFVFVRDRLPWRAKSDKLIFRGKVLDKPCRVVFMERYYGHPMVDAADVGSRVHQQWGGGEENDQRASQVQIYYGIGG